MMPPPFPRATHIRLAYLALCLGLLLATLAPSGAPAAPAHPTDVAYPIVLAPDQLTLTGDVATRATAAAQCTESWFIGTPVGSAIVGVDPRSCEAADWDGGSISVRQLLPAPYAPTVVTIKVAWPDGDGKGVHSPDPRRVASITFDDQTIWSGRTLNLGSFDDYYAVERGPILTTVVLTETGEHSLTFNAPPHTAWDISSIELSAAPAPPTVRGVAYSPYRECQMPGSSLLPTADQIRADLARLRHSASAIRTYASTGPEGSVPALAGAVGLPVYAGAWLEGVPLDRAEVATLIANAKQPGTLTAGLVVGNEFILRQVLAPGGPYPIDGEDVAYLRGLMRQVRESVPGVPVGTAETDSVIFDFSSADPTVVTRIKPAYEPVIADTDLLLVHIYPFWSARAIDGAADYTIRRFLAIRSYIEQRYPGQGKRIILGEAGWPSGGVPNGVAEPSLESQRRYLAEMLALTKQHSVDLLYFSWRDELWKVERGGIGRHWGYNYGDDVAKHSFNSMLLQPGMLGPAPSAAETPASRTSLPALADDSRPTAPAGILQIRVALPVLMRPAVRQTMPYTITDEWPAPPGSFVPSGFMGDTEHVSVYACDRSDPYHGETAIRASFTPGGQQNWGGVYWQYPENNWGMLGGWHDLSAATRVTFWAKGTNGDEHVYFFVGGIDQPGMPNHDSQRSAITTGEIVLSSTWQRYTIDLHSADMSHVIGAFGWSVDGAHNPHGATFFLDRIMYEAGG
jgi:exo-beta-1,3-glucanase (GH17 family)